MNENLGHDFLLGNEAIARGALEANIDYITGYPGTPSTEILETLSGEAGKYGIRVEWATNEMVAFENALGVSLAGLRAMVTMKHAGFNWITDPLSIAVMSGIQGGLVIVTADDPNAHSSANEQDNRFYGLFFNILTLEPASPQEAKDMTAEAFSLSEKTQLPVILRTVTRVSHARGRVVLGAIPQEKRQACFRRDLDRFFITSVRALARHRWLLQQQSVLQELAEGLSFNKLHQRGDEKTCIVTSGVAYTYVEDALREVKSDAIATLKIATPYPLPRSLIKEALSRKEVALVVEEGEPFIELQLKALVHDLGMPVRVLGKMSGTLPGAGELNVNLVTGAIAKVLDKEIPGPALRPDIMQKARAILPPRTIGFCAGCPHTGSMYALKKVINQQPVVPFVGGDIGCYTMMSFPPFNLGDAKYSIGAILGVAAGLSGALQQKTVAVLGDSTFLHAGIPSLINCVYNQKNVMLLLLDNQTTAMTGGQPHAGTGITATNEQTKAVDLERLIRACGVDFIEITDPYDLKRTEETIDRALKHEGVSVVIARRECALESTRASLRLGKELIPCEVNQKSCIAREAPYCEAACPLHQDARSYIGLIREGKFGAALAVIRETLPFPEIVSRVCTHPCELTCKRREIDEPIAICALKRAAVDYAPEGEQRDFPIAEEKGKRVAIVGGGPAGLTAACDLRRMGYRVTIFDALPHLGGMLAVGIPEFRLPREVLQKELGIIDKLGIQSRLSTKVGVDVKLSELKRDFDAVFLAIGAHKGKALAIGGKVNHGLVDGIEFLRELSLGNKMEAKGRVAIVGGGNVAIDCARTCLRLGYQQVSILYRRSREEMPAIEDEVEMAAEEGAEIVYLVSPLQLISEDGRLTNIRCIRNKLGEADKSGRRQPVPVEGSEFDIQADLVISAVGEEADISWLEKEGLSDLAEDGLLKANAMILATKVPGVFAGGDAVSGPGSVIDAMAAGRKAAISIDRFLTGQNLEADREKEGPYKTNLLVSAVGVSKSSRRRQGRAPMAQRRRDFKEVELGFSREEARAEAERCLSCGCHDCLKFIACPAMSRDGDTVNIDSALCNGCTVCGQVCPTGAIAQVRR